jgi:carboxyl-terminal processing protease
VTLRSAVLLLVLFTAACGKSPAPTAPTPASAATTLSTAARTYLEQLLTLMQQGSINRLTIDWTSFRNRVLAAAGSAQTIDELLPAIRVAIELLGDGHSSYRTPSGTVIFVARRTCSAPTVADPAVPANVGYLRVGAFSGSAGEATAFADAIQERIRLADRDDLLGWIVDLRGNGGGNMWPMVAGLGPILGESVIGYFIDPLGGEMNWEYRAGASWNAGFLIQRVTSPYRLRREQPRVAVLSDNRIASSGEASLIAFRQRANTRSFGQPTCGLSTANRTSTLSDGATLTLTVSTMADRIKTKYGESVPPDELIDDPSQVIQRAISWLQNGT